MRAPIFKEQISLCSDIAGRHFEIDILGTVVYRNRVDLTRC